MIVLKCIFLCRDLLWRHFRKSVRVVTDLGYTEIEDLCHCKTFRRADRCAKSAETTLGHIDVELCGVDPFGCAIRSFTELFHRPHRLDLNAVHGADLGALVADNTIVDLIVQTIPAVVGHRDHFMWILDGGNPLRMRKVPMVCNGDDRAFFCSPENMEQCDFQPVPQRAEGCKDVFEVRRVLFFHTTQSGKNKKENAVAGRLILRIMGLGDGKGELAPFSLPAFDRDLSAVLFDKLLAEYQSQAGALFIRGTTGSIGCSFVEQHF